MSDEFMRAPADQKVICAKVEYDSYAINKTIEDEYQIGFIVQQIIYIQHTQEVMILFKRKD